MTVIDFAPSTAAAFQFQATLDGSVYNCIVTWNLFGQRYYLNVYQLDGTLLVAKSLIGSPVGLRVQALSWDAERQQVTLVTAVPHMRPVGSVAVLNVSGCLPDAYNGQFDMLISGPDEMIYSVASDPGTASLFGAVSHDVNLVAGYVSGSLVFREPSQQFEVT